MKDNNVQSRSPMGGPLRRLLAAALSISVLFVSGAALGAVTLLLPHPRAFDDAALLGNITIALVAGAMIIATAGAATSAQSS